MLEMLNFVPDQMLCFKQDNQFSKYILCLFLIYYMIIQEH